MYFRSIIQRVPTDPTERKKGKSDDEKDQEEEAEEAEAQNICDDNEVKTNRRQKCWISVR